MAKSADNKKITMDELLSSEGEVKQISTGEVVEGKIISLHKYEVLVDLGAYGVGYVPRREIGYSHNLKVGDEIVGSVVDTELDNGYVLLSLRRAAKDKSWDEIVTKQKDDEIIEVEPYDVNRGGLLVEYDGVRGFLPVSQLSTEHYPRVNSSSNKDEILQRLNQLIGKKIKVRIIDADKKTNRLILSEKEAIKDSLIEKVKNLNIGDIVECKVTGIADFGIFVNVNGIEGLIHISEISWERVNSPSDYVKVGDTVKAKIISVDKDRLSLSIKQLTNDPWLDEIKKFKVGDKVEGTVTRITPFGAFVQLSPSVEALVHISELSGSDTNPEKVFTLNEKKEFTILDIEKDNRKISLSLGDKKISSKK